MNPLKQSPREFVSRCGVDAMVAGVATVLCGLAGGQPPPAATEKSALDSFDSLTTPADTGVRPSPPSADAGADFFRRLASVWRSELNSAKTDELQISSNPLRMTDHSVTANIPSTRENVSALEPLPSGFDGAEERVHRWFDWGKESMREQAGQLDIFVDGFVREAHGLAEEGFKKWNNRRQLNERIINDRVNKRSAGATEPIDVESVAATTAPKRGDLRASQITSVEQPSRAVPPVSSQPEQQTTVRSKARENDQKLSEARNRERVILQVAALEDGMVGPAVGVEISKKELRSMPLYQLLGVGTTPDKMVAGAEALATATARPVIPINNASLVTVLAEEMQKAGRSAPGSVAARIDLTVAEVFGRIGDAALAVHDRTSRAAFALEPSTKTVALLAKNEIAKRRPFLLVAHSQGTVIAQNAMILLVEQLNNEVNRKIITSFDRDEQLSQIKIFAVGAFAKSEAWPHEIEVVNLNSKDDPISSLGGYNEWFQKEGQNLTFDTHRYVETYVPIIALELNK